MSALIYWLSWFAGIVFCIQWIAGLYSIIDLKHRFPLSRWLAARRVVGWSALAALLYWLLPMIMHAGFWSGVQFMFWVHVMFILFPNLLIGLKRLELSKRYEKFVREIS